MTTDETRAQSGITPTDEQVERAALSIWKTRYPESRPDIAEKTWLRVRDLPEGIDVRTEARAALAAAGVAPPAPSADREKLIDDSERPTIGLAREIAGWDQDNPATTRIPHWAVNLAAHILDKGYALAAPAPAPTPAPSADRERRALNRVWAAMGCAWNPEEFRPSERDSMWKQIIEWCEEQTAGNTRIYRENQQLQSAVLAARAPVDEAKLAEVLSEAVAEYAAHYRPEPFERSAARAVREYLDSL